MHKTQKVTSIPSFHDKRDGEELTEHNSAVKVNTSSEAGTPSEMKSASRCKDGMSPSSLGESHSNIPSSPSSRFPLFSCYSSKLAFEADRFARLRRRSSLPPLFMLSPSSSVCPVVPSVLVITVDYYWYGRQDHGTFEFGFIK